MKRYVIKRIKDGKYFTGTYDTKLCAPRCCKDINKALVYCYKPDFLFRNGEEIAVEVEIKEVGKG